MITTHKFTELEVLQHRRLFPWSPLARRLDLGMNIVRAGGYRLDHLREDCFDNAENNLKRLDLHCVSAYDIALSGGEPYSAWL